MTPPSARHLFAFVVFTIFLIATTSAHALASAGAITGRVVDQDGRAVAGARVLISGEGLPLDSTITGKNGEFTFQPRDARRLTLRIAVDGFRAETLTIEAASAPVDVGTITLFVSAFSESVVVSASQVEIPLTHVTSSVTVVSGGELESRQIHSVADALRAVPGLTVISNGGIGTTTSVFPRGGESNYTLVLVDGVPANAFGGDFDFGHLSTANLERIEIVRGPQSALFGSNAIGSVVRVVTRRGGQPSAQFAAEGGHYGTSRLAGSSAGLHSGFEWGASLDQLLSDGMNGERTLAGETVANDDYTRRSGAVSAGWRGSVASLRANFHRTTDERGFPGPFGSNPIGVYEGVDVVSRGDNQRALAGVSGSVSLSPRLRVQGGTTHNRIDSDFKSPFGDSHSFSRRWTGGAQADIALGGGVDASAGIEVQRERAGSTYIKGAQSQEIPVKRRTAGYFGEGRWSSRDRLFVSAGVRIEDIHRDRIEEWADPFSPRPVLPADTVVSVNPRVGAAWIARPGTGTFTKIRGAFGTGIRPPDGFELAFSDNPELRPERSVSAEAGVDQGFAGGHGLLEATAFTNTYDDLIVAVGSFSASSRYRTDNIANARARGFELASSLRGRLGGRRTVDISGRFGYTFLDTDVLAVDQTSSAPPPFEVGQRLLRRPTHQFFGDISVSTARLTLFMRGNGRGEVLDVEPSYGTFGGLFDATGYQVWNAGGSYRIQSFIEVFARVENVFDRSYEEAFGFPALGRRATAGLRIAAGR
jgi:outer membrane cobalamin receptor